MDVVVRHNSVHRKLGLDSDNPCCIDAWTISKFGVDYGCP